MQRRDFLEAVIISSVFPTVNEVGGTGRWELERIEGDGERIVFVRYDRLGKADGEAIIAGKTGDWSVRKSIWGESKIIERGYDDRAEASAEVIEWMKKN